MKAMIYAVLLSLFVLSFPIQAASHSEQTGNSQAASAQLDLNTADVNALTHSVKGIGQNKAKAIVKYREEHGKFSSIDDLARIKGFGKKFVKNHRKELEKKFTVN